jgi:hypothetical protein
LYGLDNLTSLSLDSSPGNAPIQRQLVDTNIMELESPIASFDRDFDKFKDVRRLEPKE